MVHHMSISHDNNQIYFFLIIINIYVSLSDCHNNLFFYFILFSPSGVLLQVVNMQLLLMLVVLEIMMSLASVHMAFVGM